MQCPCFILGWRTEKKYKGNLAIDRIISPLLTFYPLCFLAIKHLGILSDFSESYRTDNIVYQHKILNALSCFVELGYVERRTKPLHWYVVVWNWFLTVQHIDVNLLYYLYRCSSCKTVLSHAEIEYNASKSPSCFVLFPVTDINTAKQAFKDEKNEIILSQLTEINLMVWTTSPWSLPLNRALAMNPDVLYSLITGNCFDHTHLK